MFFHVLTLFPDMIMDGLNTSILGKAMERGCIRAEAVNIRDYTLDKHLKVDDYTYGGGAGMLMQAQPVYDCTMAVLDSIVKRVADQTTENTTGNTTDNTENVLKDETKASCGNATDAKKTRVIYVTPQGRVFDQKTAQELAKEEDLIFLCGHYEGIDERVLEEIVTDYISIGDYVLTGGELPALVMMDAIARLVPGVLGKEESFQTESFSEGLLEYPQYTRPEVWRDKKVPDILMSGHHANIEKWRLEQSIQRTKERRPDLYRGKFPSLAGNEQSDV